MENSTNSTRTPSHQVWRARLTPHIKNTLFSVALNGAFIALTLAQAGCGQEGESQEGGEVTAPSTFNFESPEGEATVSYSGQIARHALMSAMINHVEGLEARLLSGALTPEEGRVMAELELFYDCPEDVCANEAHGLSAALPFKQNVISELSSGKNLTGKVAGNDPVGQTRDWEAGVLGWGEGAPSPDGLIRLWMAEIDRNAVQIAGGEGPLNPLSAQAITAPHVTPEGLNLAELIEKFSYGAIGFSQTADDYLDDDLDGKGLRSDNINRDSTYTGLEHAWDEGFGYVGGARDLPSYTLEEIAGSGGREAYKGAHDSDGDGQIDLNSEYQWGTARYAAQRDLSAGTRFAERIFEAFLEGRALISSANGPLSDAQFSELQGYRDEVLEAWEGALIASAVHYLNDLLSDLELGEGLTLEGYAKHWSELKGFALASQFNPRSPLSEEDIKALHAAIGETAPTLSPAALSESEPGSPAVESYRAQLLEARALIGARFGFSDEVLEAW